jgi:hypothetical protein
MVSRYAFMAFTTVLISTLTLSAADIGLRLPPETGVECPSSPTSVTRAFATLSLDSPISPIRGLLSHIHQACTTDDLARRKHKVQCIILRQLVMALFIELQTPIHERSIHQIYFLPHWRMSQPYTARSLLLCAILYYLNNSRELLHTAHYSDNVFIAGIIPTIMESHTQLPPLQLTQTAALTAVQSVFDNVKDLFPPNPFDPQHGQLHLFAPVLEAYPDIIENLLALNTKFLYQRLSTLQYNPDVANLFEDDPEFAYFFDTNEQAAQFITDILNILSGITTNHVFLEDNACVTFSRFVDLWIESGIA